MDLLLRRRETLTNSDQASDLNRQPAGCPRCSPATVCPTTAAPVAGSGLSRQHTSTDRGHLHRLKRAHHRHHLITAIKSKETLTLRDVVHGSLFVFPRVNRRTGGQMGASCLLLRPPATLASSILWRSDQKLPFRQTKEWWLARHCL